MRRPGPARLLPLLACGLAAGAVLLWNLDARYLWQGPRGYLRLDPKILPAQVFQILRRTRSERDFDYYL